MANAVGYYVTMAALKVPRVPRSVCALPSTLSPSLFRF